MTDRIDQFESFFRRADKPALEYRKLTASKLVLVTDLDDAESSELLTEVRRFLVELESDNPSWEIVPGSAYSNVDELLSRVTQLEPDLVVAYRNLQESRRFAHVSLGTYLDELLDNTPLPVLILPRLEDGHPVAPSGGTSCVLAVTDHLTGDSMIVDVAARLTAPTGTLVLAHVESDVTFDYYMKQVEMIPEIETDLVRDGLRELLLKAPLEYIASCTEVLRRAGLRVRVESEVRFGHRVEDFRQVLGERSVDLLVLHTTMDATPAMHGMAHIIATTFRDKPLLML